MAGLGPWPPDRRVAAGVSGGADSLCLAWLLALWGRPLALVLDHGLRPGSAAEAEATVARLGRLGIPSRRLVLRGLAPGSALQARARSARRAALIDAAEAEGLADLLLGHHAADQAETVAMRAASGSGPSGLAGMSALVHGERVRLVRPLLELPPARLRATLRAAGIGWIEDPSNADPRFLRTRLRAVPPGSPGPGAGIARGALEAAVAETLARGATIDARGFACLAPGPVMPEALGALLRLVAGRAYPLPARRLAALAASPGAGVLGGARLMQAGRLGPGLLLLREAAAQAGAVPARRGALWDGRFRLAALPPGLDVEGLTMAAALPGDPVAPDLPAAVRRTLPVVRRGARLLGWPGRPGWRFDFVPAHPAAGLPFLAPPSA